ncbi:MAG: Fic family protein [Verrucomicrobiae bacterium]|nr:Fic family protein [Verrucomicrobiae bacterium]
MPAPPLTLTARLVDLVARIGEALGRWEGSGRSPSPQLRRENRIRSIQASLAIENNSLSLGQVTDIIDGKRVLGLPREIKEVWNALKAYEMLENLDAGSVVDFLKAHAALMSGLVDDAGRFRKSGVGIYRGTDLVHMAPPADRVPHQIKDLLDWLGHTDTHPLLASAVVHYEIEFIHPFSDGNGRIGRLWQTLALCRWRPEFAWLPVETVVHDHQAEYYEALAASDKQADAAPFAEFILNTLLETLANHAAGDQVSDHLSDHVKRLLSVFVRGEILAASEIRKRLGIKHPPTFRSNYLRPALAAGWIAMTQPESPRSPTQGYRLTSAGEQIRT